MKRRFALIVACCFALLLLGLFLLLWLPLPGSGAERLEGLVADVDVSFDALGVPTLEAKTLPDLLRAQGFITARERLFQMDLIRRRAAGRLSEIFGKGALEQDLLRRKYGFGAVAKEAARLMTPETLLMARAYADGVNAFIRSGPLPSEMRVINYHPYEWTPADTVLVVLSMFDKNEDPPGEEERVATLLRAKLDPKLFALLTPESGFLDAPLIADPPSKPWRGIFPSLPARSEGGSTSDRSTNGSNAWALAGSRTQSGAPLLASDPHLGLNAPNLWYRLSLKGGGVDATGVTLPGVPLILIGSNTKVAWGLTNGMIDDTDWVLLGDLPKRRVRHEKILVRGAGPVALQIEESEWGPVFESPDGTRRALQWTALDPSALAHASILELNLATDVDSALKALETWSGPVHNVLLASKDGHIGWSLVGKIPNRVGFDGSYSVPRDAHHFWKGYLPVSAIPRVIDPPEGFLVSANQRSFPSDSEIRPFGHHFPSPARAHRIRELLRQRKDWTASSAQAMQTDSVSPTHLWYRDKLLECPALAERLPQMVAELKEWNGKAEVTSRIYPFLRAFRKRAFDELVFPYLPTLPAADRDVARDFLLRDATLFRISLAKHPSFCEGLVRAAVAARAEVAPETTWGSLNRAAIRHPFSFLLPAWLARPWNFPQVELAGDQLTLGASRPAHGASMRMVVDLADPSRSLFSQPGGQSGHLLSAHYRDQFQTWAEGRATALLPGTPAGKILLRRILENGK